MLNELERAGMSWNAGLLEVPEICMPGTPVPSTGFARSNVPELQEIQEHLECE